MVGKQAKSKKKSKLQLEDQNIPVPAKPQGQGGDFLSLFFWQSLLLQFEDRD